MRLKPPDPAGVRAHRLAEAPDLYRAQYKRALDGKASPRVAIKAFCLECVGYVRKDVTNCTAYACPLYEYRPEFKE
jgi:hypothetical protein